MTCWDDFEGDLVVAANKTVEYAEGKAPAFSDYNSILQNIYWSSRYGRDRLYFG